MRSLSLYSSFFLSVALLLPSLAFAQSAQPTPAAKIHWLGSNIFQIDPHFCSNRLFTSRSVAGASGPSVPGDPTNTYTSTEEFLDFTKNLETVQRKIATTYTTINGVKSSTAVTTLDYALELSTQEKNDLARIFNLEYKFATPYDGAQEKCKLSVNITLKNKPSFGSLPKITFACSWMPLPITTCTKEGCLPPGPAIIKEETLAREKFHIISNCG